MVNLGGHTIFRENSVYYAQDFMQSSLLFVGVCTQSVTIIGLYRAFSLYCRDSKV